ncbi:hypothetical protein ACFLZ7_03105 [Nanoarchaeota archaeon]
MNKKGVELSMNVIIIAAIALLVLVVLSVIFLGRIGTFGETASSCEAQGGKCAIACGDSDYKTQDFSTMNPTITCEDTSAGESRVCCIPVK